MNKKIKIGDKYPTDLGFGCWQLSGKDSWSNFNEKEMIETVEIAIAKGINFFDVAPVYGLGKAESLLGKIVKKKRKDIIIASKCGLVWDEKNNVTNNLTRKSLNQEIDESLKRLNTDYIDLYQIHWPDPNTNIKETILALEDIKREGKILEIGVSNFSLDLLKEAMKYGNIKTFQGLYNMIERNASSYHNIKLGYEVENEIFTFLKENNMEFLPYSPLMQGLLSGKYNKKNNFDEIDVRSSNPELNNEKLLVNLEKVEKLKLITKDINMPLSAIAIKYILEKGPIMSVIAGASNINQLDEHLQYKNFKLPKEIINEIDKL
ncbi:aldo/keto reductase [Clostridiaceae bacterium HSG29]|nr:aldo/keto reductase [Clostridiaceae bacterium HSG29]